MVRHRFVAAFLAGEGDDLHDLLPLLDPARPAEAAVAAAIRALWGEGDPGAVLRAADPVFDGGEFGLLGALVLAALALRTGQARAGEALLARCRRQLASCPPGLRAFAEGVRSLQRAHAGDAAGYLDGLRRALALLPDDDPRWGIQAWIYGLDLARQGRLRELGDGIGRLGSARPQGPDRAAGLRLIDACERGDLETAAAAWPRVAADLSAAPDLIPDLRHLLHAYGRLLAVLRGDSGHGDGPYPALASLAALRRGDAERALVLARQDEQAPVRSSSLHDAALVRAELASGHGPAALRLLALRRDHGCRTCGEDALWAQASWLAGRPDEAARHLAAAEAEATRRAASGRLDLEWDLAIGLPRGALVALLRHAPPAPACPLAGSSASAGGSLIGSSAAMAAVREAIARCAPSATPVLLCGETGTGKELAARLLHAASPRARQPFIAINAAALSETLMESELFGHERGAFTGAVAAHAGCFEQAAEGTLFLDEIGDIPPRLQAGLLRVLEDGRYRRVGGAHDRETRCRIVCATHRDLATEVAAGRFRADLLWRLQRLVIRLPPLRERPDDIAEIALHLLRRDAPEPDEVRLAPGLIDALRQRRWPGNVRELRNVLERMRIQGSERGDWRAEDLPLEPPAAGRLDADGRRARLRELFRVHGRMRRGECMRLLGISQQTATADLRALIADGLIVKRTPTAAPRTHFFELA